MKYKPIQKMKEYLKEYRNKPEVKERVERGILKEEYFKLINLLEIRNLNTKERLRFESIKDIMGVIK